VKRFHVLLAAMRDITGTNCGETMFNRLLLVCTMTACVVFASSGARGDDAPAATQPSTKLKVGILVSQYTATGPFLGGGRPYGYDHAKIAAELKDESVQLIPIIEPGSENDGDLADTITHRFPDAEGQVFSAGDASALKTLNVIVLSRVPNLKDDALGGIHQAVSEGTSLLIVGRVGNLNPGYKDEKVRDLVGMKEAQYAWESKLELAELIEPIDPLLKDALPEGQELRIAPAGALGKLKEGSRPIAKLASRDGLRLPADEPAIDADFYAIYATSLGKGKIIVCNWTNLPSVLKPSGFYVRCCHHLTDTKGK